MSVDKSVSIGNPPIPTFELAGGNSCCCVEGSVCWNDGGSVGPEERGPEESGSKVSGSKVSGWKLGAGTVTDTFSVTVTTDGRGGNLIP